MNEIETMIDFKPFQDAHDNVAKQERKIIHVFAIFSELGDVRCLPILADEAKKLNKMWEELGKERAKIMTAYSDTLVSKLCGHCLDGNTLGMLTEIESLTEEMEAANG